ncbi:MAG: alanine--tRNA ligase [Candidatus Bathyarchaeia archaeon]
MKFEKEEYTLPLFFENGFERKRCRVCGDFYWTQNPAMDICGDAPCQEYTFIGKPPTRRAFTIEELREEFLRYFERNGHTRVKPYPVIARWRDDLFVTIASIADFQPYVTDGLIPPPANPLVVSQPCLRFLDVDNVGLTAGRHLVIFEMGGHHAFNYPDRYVYWKDETVRYHHDFITECLGVRSEEVTYKEGSWSGGGNAGPCLEGSVGGLEVCTLVFMQYRVSNGQLENMPLKIVDTGYGVERYTWLSQGSPSGFHAIYGDLLSRLLSLAGVNRVEERILVESAKFSALMKIESTSDRRVLRSKVAERVGVEPGQLEALMTPLENVYAIADHTKALAFMLAEGVVPSNVKAGYLVRLLIRRTYRLLRSLGIEDKLPEIVEWQIERWSPSFPNLLEMRGEILEALAAEERKYRATLKRGEELTHKLSRELKARGQYEITATVIAELYDSHGVPPEVVAEAAKSEGVKVHLPDNFYTIVASRHQAPTQVREETRSDATLSSLNLQATETIYYDDPYTTTFKARVLEVVGQNIILDRTAFYPGGGGQVCDTGFLLFDGNEVEVTEVTKVGNLIIHRVSGVTPNKGQEVHGKIDWNRRLSLMRHHTSTHILLGAVREVLGQHAWQAGAEKEVMQSRLDVSHWERIRPEQLAKIELLANQRVMDNIPVDVQWLPREEAEKRYGFRLYQGGVVPGRLIRVVKIGDWDVEACGGTHLRTTGEVGVIKILHTERIQDGVERIVFSSGMPALEYIQSIELQAKTASEALNVPSGQLSKHVSEILEKTRLLEKELKQLKERMVLHELKETLQMAKTLNGVRLILHSLKDVSPEAVIGAASIIAKEEPDVVFAVCSIEDRANLIILAGDQAVKHGINAGAIASQAALVLGGGGGGKPNFGQGGGSRLDMVEEALKTALTVAARQVGGS